MSGGAVRRLCLAALVVASGGCAEVAFKAGAGPGEMAAAEAACRASHGEAASYSACMKERGYLHTMARPARSSAARSVAAGAAAAPGAKVAAPAAEVAGSGARGTAPSAEGAATAAGSPPSPSPAAQIDAGPTRVVSWWKLGGTAAGLEADQRACREAAGAAGEAPSDLVTPAVIGCLEERGWYPLGR